MLSSKTFPYVALAGLLPFHCVANLGYEVGVAPRSNLLPDQYQYLSIREDTQQQGTFTPPGDFGKSEKLHGYTNSSEPSVANITTRWPR
jgi:hypothetical protein